MRLHVNGWHHRCINLSSSLVQSRGMCRSCKRCTQPLLTLLKNIIYPCIIYSIPWENISMYRIICQEHFRNNLFACYREILTALQLLIQPVKHKLTKHSCSVFTVVYQTEYASFLYIVNNFSDVLIIFVEIIRIVV